jgi:predicted RND superfamily exporter protein
MGGKNQSSWFDVTSLASRDIDTLWRRLTVMADYRSIEAFLFHWDFGNSSAEKYNQSAKVLMSFLVGCMLVVFAFYLWFDSQYFTQLFLLVVGVTGVFAANPVNYFTGRADQ